MSGWIPDETPILESVFVDVADGATDINRVVSLGLPDWYWVPLSWSELMDWTDERLGRL